jgi:hypothetical protein
MCLNAKKMSHLRIPVTTKEQDESNKAKKLERTHRTHGNILKVYLLVTVLKLSFKNLYYIFMYNINFGVT